MDFVRKPSKAVPGGAAEGGLKLPSGKKIIKPAAALLAKARAKLAGKAPEAAERTILKKTPETPPSEIRLARKRLQELIDENP